MVAVERNAVSEFWIKEGLLFGVIKVNEDSLLPDLPDGPPLLREHPSVPGGLADALLWLPGIGTSE